MNTYMNKVSKIAKKLLPFTILIFFLIMIAKQIGLYDRIVSIYASCLPVFMGAIIAFLLQPIIDRLKRRFSTRTSVLIVYSFILIALFVFLIVLIPVLYQQVLDFIEVVPVWLEKIEYYLNKYHIFYGDLEDLKQQYLNKGYVFMIDSLKHSMTTLTKYGIAYFTAFFISIDLEFWKRSFQKIYPNAKRFKTFYRTMSNIVYQYLLGTMIDLMFIILSVGAVLIISQFPNGILYAVILALLNLFPYVGATIGLILIAIVGLLSYDNFPFLIFVIVWCIQQIEANFIQPLIFNHTMNVRPILTFTFIFISEAFFGVVGVILSPIFAAIAQIAFRSYLHAKTSERVGEWEDIWYDFDDVMASENCENGCM